MKNRLLVVAVAGALTAPLTFAEVNVQKNSNVTIYGIADVGYSNLDYGSATRSRISSDAGSGGSRLGVKGSHDLGKGNLKANWNLEVGIPVDGNGNGASTDLFFRQTWAGLSGDFGSLVVGRDYSLTFLAAFRGEYCGWCGIASPAGLTQQGVRESNYVKYETPKFNGFSAALGHVAGENKVTSGQGNKWELAGFYEKGPFNGAYVHRNTKLSASTSQAGNYLAGNLAMGPAKVYALLGNEKTSGIGTTNERYTALGVGFKLAGGDLNLQWATVKDSTGADRDTSLGGISYFYPYTDLVTFYAQYGRVDNKALATRTTWTGTDSPALAAGTDLTGMQAGIKVSF